MLPFMLMAAQAAGYATSIYSRKAQEKMARYGDELDRGQMRLQMESEQLASTEQALYNTERLRDVLATQRALAASRGQQSGQGSNLMVAQASQRAYNADENARRISMSFRKNQFESMQRLMGIKAVGRNSLRRSQNIQQGFNMLSTQSSQQGLNQFLNSGSKLPS